MAKPPVVKEKAVVAPKAGARQKVLKEGRENALLRARAMVAVSKERRTTRRSALAAAVSGLKKVEAAHG